MKINNKKDLWKYREASGMKNHERFILLVLVIAGIISLVKFADWWFREEHIGNFWLFILLSTFFWYSMSRVVLSWINYLNIKKPESIAAPEGLSVAIYTTSYAGEPLAMVEKTLQACKMVSYPHKTYLLDNTGDPAFKETAERNGTVWIDSSGLEGAKAGKINNALKQTSEDFILILDPDHIPFPNFLDKTLGYFQDENIGFVQVSQAYYNQYRSFTAKGAAEQTYSFYGPTQMGLNGLGCSVAIGANCTFRRKALESIGGHAIGLAEDLLTSIRIHSAGWKSVYNPVVVSRGLVPEDFGSFCKQQLKWARGVFEIMFVEIPKVFRKLTGWQKFSYLAIGTYYLVGVISFFFTFLPFLFFLTGIIPARMPFADFLIHGAYLIIISVLIYFYTQKWLCHPETEKGFHWRGMILKYACWPVFFLGFLLAVVNVDIPYIPTPKKAMIGYTSPFARPLIVYIFLFLITVTIVIIHRRYFVSEGELISSAEKTWGMIGFAFIAFVMSLFGLIAAWSSRRLKDEDPWDKVNLNDIKI